MSRADLAELEAIGRLRMQGLGVLPAPAPLQPPGHVVEPSRERRQRGPVVRDSKTVQDANGQIGRPFRAVDVVAALEKRSAITKDMREAAEKFRRDFRLAQLDPLKSHDLGRPRGGAGAGDSVSVEAARRRIWEKVKNVGGIASPAGSCLWHVLGWEMSLKDWALQQGWAGRRVNQQVATGILVAALGVLARA